MDLTSLKYSDRQKSMQIFLSKTQTGPGRTGKQEQEQTSRSTIFLANLCRYNDQTKGPSADRLGPVSWSFCRNISAETRAAQAFLLLFRLITKFYTCRGEYCNAVSKISMMAKRT